MAMAKSIKKGNTPQITISLKELSALQQQESPSSTNSEETMSSASSDIDDNRTALQVLEKRLDAFQAESEQRDRMWQKRFEALTDERNRAWNERFDQFTTSFSDRIDALTDHVEDLATQMATLRRDLNQEGQRNNERFDYFEKISTANNSEQHVRATSMNTRLSEISDKLTALNTDLALFKNKIVGNRVTDLQQTEQTINEAHKAIEIARRDFFFRADNLSERVTNLEKAIEPRTEISTNWNRISEEATPLISSLPSVSATPWSPPRLVDPTTNEQIILPNRVISPSPTPFTIVTTKPSKPKLIDPSTGEPITIPKKDLPNVAETPELITPDANTSQSTNFSSESSSIASEATKAILTNPVTGEPIPLPIKSLSTKPRATESISIPTPSYSTPTKICIHYRANKSGSCRNGASCAFAHIPERTVVSKAGTSITGSKSGKKSILCHHFFDRVNPGKCWRGEQCHFAHSIDEMRAQQVLEDAILESPSAENESENGGTGNK